MSGWTDFANWTSPDTLRGVPIADLAEGCRQALQEKRWGKSTLSNNCWGYTPSMNSPIVKGIDKFSIAADLKASVYGLCAPNRTHGDGSNYNVGLQYLDTFAGGFTAQPYPGNPYNSSAQMLSNLGLSDIPVVKGVDFPNLFYLLYRMLNELYISMSFMGASYGTANYSFTFNYSTGDASLSFPREIDMGEVITVYWIHTLGITHGGIISGSPVSMPYPGYGRYFVIDAREAMNFK